MKRQRKKKRKNAQRDAEEKLNSILYNLLIYRVFFVFPIFFVHIKLVWCVHTNNGRGSCSYHVRARIYILNWRTQRTDARIHTASPVIHTNIMSLHASTHFNCACTCICSSWSHHLLCSLCAYIHFVCTRSNIQRATLCRLKPMYSYSTHTYFGMLFKRVYASYTTHSYTLLGLSLYVFAHWKLCTYLRCLHVCSRLLQPCSCIYMHGIRTLVYVLNCKRSRYAAHTTPIHKNQPN